MVFLWLNEEIAGNLIFLEFSHDFNPLGNRTSWRRHRYVPNETPNDVSVECRQDVSLARLHDILLERLDDALNRRNNDVPSVRFHIQRRFSGMSPRLLSGT